MKIFISLGDLSARNYVYEIFKEGFEDWELVGITDSKLESIGIKSVASISQISVVGITEALSKVWEVRRVFKRAREALKDCDVLLACDAPGFNLPLIKEAKKLGVKKVIYFISPQVWAWKPRRAQTVATYSDHLVVILPFEREIYKRYEGKDFKVHYEGHPLVDIAKPTLSREEFLKGAGVEEDFVGILLGSRWNEVKKHAPLLREVLREVKLGVVLPTFAEFEGFLRSNFTEAKILTEASMEKPSYNVLSYSLASLIASGTASLEGALLGCVHGVFYRVSPLTYLLGKLLVKVPYVSLPNIILKKRVVPEHINPDPKELRKTLSDLLEREDLRNRQKEAFSEIRHLLGEKGVVERLRNLFREIMKIS